MKRFLVIKNETDLDRVRRLRPRLLDDATALAVSPLAVLLLRQGGHEPVTLFDYLRSVDLAAIYDDAAGAAAGWFEVLDGDLTTEERELFGCLEMDLFELFAHATAADRALDRLLSEHGRAVFHLFEPPGVACIGTMALFCRHPVTEAVIRYRAAKGEAFIEWIRPLPAMDPRRWVHGLLRRMLPTNPLRHERVLPESRKDLERSWPPRLAEAGSRDQHLLLVGNAHNLRTLFTVLASHNEGGISRISALNLDDGLPSFEERAGLSGEGEYYRLRSIPIDADQRALWKSRLWELGQRFSRLRLESPEPELANPY
ncbi:MAG TPA: hypothetical protein VNB06_12525, partial [Thermoanaerobaculia bacterium]|nr:hypothetical protein [Thermoanaerobaculia bacterium]